MDKKLAGLLAGAGGAAVALYLYERRRREEEEEIPPGPFSLSVQAVADGVSVSVPVRVDGRELTTPGSLELPGGRYAVSAPDRITYAGEEYEFERYEVV